MHKVKKIVLIALFLCLVCRYVFLSEYYQPSDLSLYRGKLVRAVILEPDFINEDRRLGNYLIKLIEIIPNHDILSPESVTRSLEALYRTGFFSSITVSVRQSFDGVAVIFKFQKWPMIKSIKYNGIPHSVRKKIQYLILIEKNKPFNEKAFEESFREVQPALRKTGYPEAEVRYKIIPFQNETVIIQIIFQLGKPLTITKIEVGSNSKTASEALSKTMLKNLKIKESSIYDESMMINMIRKTIDVFRKDGYVGTTISHNTIIGENNNIILQLEWDPGIKPVIQVIGYRLSKNQIKKLVTLQREQAISDALLDSWAKNIADFLNENKYYNPQVHYEFNQEKARITFAIQPGHQYKIIKINWEGNHYHSVYKLNSLKLFQGGYVESRAGEELERLKDFYRESGFLDIEAKVNKILYNPPDILEVNIGIHEEDQTEIEKINVYGLTVFTDTYIKGLMKIFRTNYFSPQMIQKDIQILQNEYLAQGYLNISIHYSVSERQHKNKINVDLKINEGNKVSIDRILISGNYATSASFIEKYFDLEPDGPLLFKNILSTQKKLYDLGIFDKVDIVYPRFTSLNSNVDVIVKLDEAPHYTLSYGVGYQQEDKVRGFISLVRNNLFGNGIRSELLARYGFIEKRIFYSFYQPKLFSTPFHTLLVASYEQQSRVSFSFHRLAVSAQIEFPVTSTAKWMSAYSYNKTDTYNEKIPSYEIIRIYRDVDVSSIAGIFIQDKRNDAFDPTRGYFFSGSLEYAPKWLKSQQQFLKLYTQFQCYYQFIKKVTFAFSTRLGMIQSYQANGFVPISLRFFAGGSKSFRGTSLDRLGPNVNGYPLGGSAMFINNFEFRVSLTKDFGIVAFYDLGSVWRKVTFITYSQEYRHAAGLGVRYNTPVGPIAFDLGRLLHPLPDENKYHYYLSIGHAF